MTEPKAYKLDQEKLKWAHQSVLPYLLGAFYYTEDYEYFDEIKNLLIVPEEPKTLEQICQEFDEKFDKLIETTKEKFEYSKISSEKRYKYEFDKIFKKFEQAKKYGKFTKSLTIVGSGSGSFLISTDSPNWVTYNYIIKPDANCVGYYEISPNTQYWMKKKPNFIVRNFARLLLDLHWKDT